MEKINIAELLKDCPKGMELESPAWNSIVFEEIDGDSIVIFRKLTGDKVYLTRYGELNSFDGNCVIFPKGKTTWEGFVPPCKFKDGDIVATEHGLFIGIVKVKNNMQVNTYCSINSSGCFEINSTYGFERLAAEEEKQKLFDAIKANGYKWNAETKTLEELTEQKFDITTLKPYQKVLFRQSDDCIWLNSFFGFYDKNAKTHPFICCNGFAFKYCIPYKGNQHLLGTTIDCDEFYKTWE